MTVDDNKATAARVFADIMQGGHLHLIAALFTPDVVGHDPGQEFHGRAALTHGLASLRAAFPDLQFTVEDMVADGDTVAVRYTGQGTQQGPIWGIPPTGKRMRYTGILIWRFVAGQIAEHWAEPDRLGILQQLGALDVPGQSGQ